MTATTLSVPDISCDHCRDAIQGATTSLEGVAASVVNIEERTVTVTYRADEIQLPAIVEAIEEQGYEVAQ